MKRIIVFVSIGFIVFLLAVLLRDPNKILPSGPSYRKNSQSNQSCPNPFVFKMPIDLNKTSSILYPGQYRGGDYKAHGGFRFDGFKPNQIIVTVPYDARVIDGARYPVNGEIQYAFDFEHPCGIRYRFMHLLTLTPKFQAIAEKLPLPKEADSRTTEIYPPVEVKQGEIIATAVGLSTGGPEVFGGFNTFVDWESMTIDRKMNLQKTLIGSTNTLMKLNNMRSVGSIGYLMKIGQKFYLFPPQIPKTAAPLTIANN